MLNFKERATVKDGTINGYSPPFYNHAVKLHENYGRNVVEKMKDLYVQTKSLKQIIFAS